MIWYNSNILVGKKPVFIKYWSELGINFIKDLLDRENNFLQYPDFCQKLQRNVPQLQYQGIINAIPKHWKKTLKSEENILSSSSETDTIGLGIHQKLETVPKIARYIYSLLAKDQKILIPKLAKLIKCWIWIWNWKLWSIKQRI